MADIEVAVELFKQENQSSEIEPKKESILDLYYEDVSDIKEFSSWIMRAWFNAEKHAEKPWYKAEITVSTVIKHITKNPKFPYSPSQIIEIWKALPSIQKGLNANSSSEEIAIVEEETGVTYKKGEITLTKIGSEMGDVSATMVKKLGDGAEEKIKKFYHGKPPSELSLTEEEDLIELVEEARLEAAIDFTAALKATNGDIKLFFAGLVKGQILSVNEVDLITPEEIQALHLLYTIDQDIIEEILIQDIEDDNNTFKTYQNSVSKKVFPAGKRGRPKKNAEFKEAA